MIKIAVDSASDCKKEDNLYDIFVPITVSIDGKEYADGVDIDKDTFYNLLVNTKEFPRTSQPSPQSFIEIFEKVKEDGDELIYFALSSKLSGTYQCAVMAKEMVDYDNIYIIDTKLVSHLIGILVRHASQLRAKGASAKEIVEQCEALKTKIKVFAGVDTLEYLRRGGRLSNASAAVGTLANIKPTVTVTEEGTVENIGKYLGRARAINAIVEKIKSFDIDDKFPICSLFTCGTENSEELENKLTSEGYKVRERLQIGSAIGAHLGPGVYAALFVIK